MLLIEGWKTDYKNVGNVISKVWACPHTETLKMILLVSLRRRYL